MTRAGKGLLGIGGLMVAGITGIVLLPTAGALATFGGMWLGMRAIRKNYDKHEAHEAVA